MATTGCGIPHTYATTLAANDSTAKEALGTLRFETDANGMKVYKYVLSAATTAVANGDVVNNSGVTAYTVTVPGTTAVGKAANNIGAGVGIGTITSAYYGWVQVKGYHSAIKKAAKCKTSAGLLSVISSNKIVSANCAKTSGIVNWILQLSSKACACTTCPGLIQFML